LRRPAESGRVDITIGEFGPPSPPKSRRVDVLNAERVCQANAGPWGVDKLEELLISSHGGDEMLNEMDNGRYNRSLEVGAEL
jgi:hypothetical protein